MMVRCVGLSDSLMLNPYPVDCGPSLGFDLFGGFDAVFIASIEYLPLAYIEP